MHFTVMVMQDNNSLSIDEMLEPYCEELRVPHLITRAEIISKVREDIKRFRETAYARYIKDPGAYKAACSNNQNHIKYISEEFPRKLQWSDDECYADGIKYYDSENILADGSVFSTCNPNAKWDWYQIGGRWNGSLILKGDAESTTDSATIGELDLGKMADFCTYAVIEPNGMWVSPGGMGWFGSSETEEESDKWDSEFMQRFIVGRDPSITLTIVDCHI